MTEQKQRTRQNPPWEREGDTESVPFGSWLRQQRELREITLREISDATKISLRYLEALEDERFDLLPAPVFAKGFLRQYARYVGIDPEEVVNFFSDARRQQAEEQEDALAGLMGEPPRRSRSNLLYGLLVLLVVAALVGLVWWLTQLREDRRAEERARGGGVAAVASGGDVDLGSAGAGSDEALTRPLRATLDFNGECEVTVYADGERELKEYHVQGESLRVGADDELIFELSDERVVELVVNGHPYRRADPDGEEGTDGEDESTWLRFTREQLADLERGEPIEPLEVPVGEDSPRRPPPEGSSSGATGAA